MKPSSSSLEKRKAFENDKPFLPLTQSSSLQPQHDHSSKDSKHAQPHHHSSIMNVPSTTHVQVDTERPPLDTSPSLNLLPSNKTSLFPSDPSTSLIVSPHVFTPNLSLLSSPPFSFSNSDESSWLPSVTQLLDERLDLNAFSSTTTSILDQGEAFVQLLERRGIDSPNKVNLNGPLRKTTRLVVPFPTLSSTSTTSNMCQALPNLYSNIADSSQRFIPMNLTSQVFFTRLNLLDQHHPTNAQSGCSSYPSMNYVDTHRKHLRASNQTCNQSNTNRPRVTPQRCLTPEQNRPSSPPSVKKQYRKVKREMTSSKTIVHSAFSSPRGITKTSSRNESRRILVNRVAQLFQHQDEEDAL